MKTLLTYAAIAVAAIVFIGCDSENPTQATGSTGNVVLKVETVPKQVQITGYWEVWEDISNPRDGIPDRPKRTQQPNGPIIHRCDSELLGNPITPEGTIYPWGLSVTVVVYRSGSTQPEVISTTSAGTDRYTATTPLSPDPGPVTKAPDTQNSAATEFYRNGLQFSNAHPAYALLCQNQPSIIPNLGPGLPTNPASITLNKGDTLVVLVRKALSTANPVLGGALPIPIIVGTLTVNGHEVPLQGVSQSTEADGDGLSFSYTLN